MANRFATGKIALGICDRCGLTYYLKELRKEIVKGKINNLKVCPDCFDPDHPQLHLGELPIDDPQALRDPRPDQADYGDSRAQIVPILGVISFGRVGQVTVSTT